MATLTAKKIMLYCPKCQRKYEKGNQRFCNNDGGRLLPAVNAGVKRQNQSKGVFTNLLTKTSKRNEKDEHLANKPRFVKAENKEPRFETPQKSRVFTTDQKFTSKVNQAKPQSSPKTKTNEGNKLKTKENAKQKQPKVAQNSSKPLSRLITAKNDINIGRAELGDRKTNPKGRDALTWQNIRVLVGQMIKGRYKVIDKTDQDQTSVAYLAQDQIHQGKKVIVRVLMEEASADEFQKKLIAEERVSLSHIIHPNIAKVIDSGELPEGKPFIVTEFVENETVKDFLKKTGIFNPMRTARVIRQSSMALSEVHQNGILHRNLQPQHLLLTVSEAGNETVKVSDFCVSDGKITSDNFRYKAPEQLSGQLPTYASDSYSLAVIAYKMLTNVLPFKGESEREVLKSQKVSLSIGASNLNPDINPLVDNILSKALAFNPSDRYPKSRDFGEALFNALTTATPWEDSDSDEIESLIETKINLQKKEEKIPLPSLPIGFSNETKLKENTDISVKPNNDISGVSSDIHIDSSEHVVEIEQVQEAKEVIEDEFVADVHDKSQKSTLWKKRSPEPTREGGWLFTIFSILGILLLFGGAFAIWSYFNNREEPAPQVAVQTSQPKTADPTISEVDDVKKVSTPMDEIDIPPPERNIVPPKDFQYFENSKQNLKGDLVKNFRGFTLYYPDRWKKYDSATNYLDVKLKDDDGFPKQQFIVTRYESKGTFELDNKNFPKLVANSNKDLVKILPNYESVSQGEKVVNNGWKVYEVKFKGKTDFAKKEDNFEIWGKRIWMPAARPGINNGFVITMLATSLSDKIESLDDVGKTGDLGEILRTFEPEHGY